MRIQSLLFTAAVVFAFSAIAQDDETAAVPESLRPFEHLIGSWKGQAVPTANRLKGWPEKHMWAWKFEKGEPVGLTVEFEGGKVLSKGSLTFDASAKRYKLAGATADKKPVVYAGTLDDKGRNLVLDRVNDASAKDEQRLTILLNSNQIRYTMRVDQKDADAPQFSRQIETGLTKEGEAFAAGGGGEDLPKCIITGGAATIAVSFQGKSFNVCCTGCRDAFNENPEKYVKKAERLALAQNSAPKGKADAPKPAEKPAAKEKNDPDDEPEADSTEKDSAKPKRKEAPKSKGSANPATKATSLLAQAKALEKSGKTKAALEYFKRLVKDYPDAPETKTAKERIKALEK